MKIATTLTITILAIWGNAFSQNCPPSALKIQSPICDTPRNLRVNEINCTTVKLNWRGNKMQQYLVAAKGKDNIDNALFDIKAATYSCDDNGNCSAIISVKEGARIEWNVQAICNIRGVTIYSPKVNGAGILIPHCGAIASDLIEDNKTNGTVIKVYPNPTTGNLTVEYQSKTAGPVRLTVFDIKGRSILNQSRSAAIGNNIYAVDLPQVIPGNYLLQLKHGGETNRMKFVLVRK